MPAIFFPKISEQDHEILKSTMRSYPYVSYDQWLASQAEAISGWKASGAEITMVELTADDFARYAKQTRARYDANLLKSVAFAKGQGKFK